jgi:hypothetical protein
MIDIYELKTHGTQICLQYRELFPGVFSKIHAEKCFPVNN